MGSAAALERRAQRVQLSVFKPLRDYIDSLVHPAAQHDALTAARHRAFIAPRLLGALAALAVCPVYIVVRGVPSALEIAVFGWLIVPIMIACFLSQTGRYETAHVLSSFALTAIVTAVAWQTGGIASFAAIWLVVVPLEAALSASRRVVALAALCALAAAGVLLIAQSAALLPASIVSPGAQGGFAALGIVSAALYAAGLALGSESLSRTGMRLLNVEEDRYRLLARNMTDVIARHGQHGAIRFISPAAGALLGARPEDLTGHGLFDRVHVADRPAYLTALADAAALQEVKSVEFRLRRDAADARGPQFIWVEMRCRPLDAAAGECGGKWQDRVPDVVSVIRDISERKEQEQALHAARADSERADAAKTRFLATMSHELRTPLNAIIGFSEMLTRDEEMRLDALRRRDYARLINDSGHHLLAVVNGILDMSKMETGDFEITPEPFAAGETIGNCCDLLALRARESSIDLVTRVPADLPEINADRRAFKQILLNLLSNAIKFSDAGGCVTVSAGIEAGRMLLAVEDNGIGISDSDMPRIGSPFFQATSAYDRRHDGTGLGLSIVKGLVALHGGDVEIRSTLGRGTRVVVALPLDCGRHAPRNIVETIHPMPLRPQVAGAETQTGMQADVMRKSA
jgi:cell cycle sensor histidine kinase DivJ